MACAAGKTKAQYCKEKPKTAGCAAGGKGPGGKPPPGGGAGGKRPPCGPCTPSAMVQGTKVAGFSKCMCDGKPCPCQGCDQGSGTCLAMPQDGPFKSKTVCVCPKPAGKPAGKPGPKATTAAPAAKAADEDKAEGTQMEAAAVSQRVASAAVCAVVAVGASLLMG